MTEVCFLSSHHYRPALQPLRISMSIHETERTSPLDLGPNKGIKRRDAETKEPGIGKDKEHRRSPGGQEEKEVESGEAEKVDHASATAPGQNPALREVGSDEEKDVELDKEEKKHQVLAAPPLPSANVANGKTVFGMKRSSATVMQDMKNASDSTSYLIHF
ncbi:hypothetical protein IW261DRAFT_1497140 [Armillaria novae-zelandiae]|uniref:Uncharacterized protein n=1 Tax=Armillaria novae-zelandiae TaxID=153914 RepID=A0AA39UDL2_9AGAR|nr:hypothetical protein IW261DRAFT_1497140 [Armillaria novae-zelandiae]